MTKYFLPHYETEHKITYKVDNNTSATQIGNGANNFKIRKQMNNIS